MRVLLTGASGNLGRGVLRSLVDRGHRVLAVSRNRARLAEVCQPFGNRVEAHACDLSSPGDLSLPNDYDAVVHTAAHATAQESADAHVLHNVIGTRHLLRHAAQRSQRPFIFFSSLSVYGTIHDPVVDEQTPTCNPGSYGASKLLGEQMLREYASRLASIALRLPGILGPGARDPWLARVLAAARSGNSVSISTPETPFNNAVHVDDLGVFVCDLLTQVQPGFDALTLGASEPRTVLEVVSTMLSTVNPRININVIKSPRSPFIISSKRAVEQYGFQPASVLNTVRRFAAFDATSVECNLNQPVLS